MSSGPTNQIKRLSGLIDLSVAVISEDTVCKEELLGPIATHASTTIKGEYESSNCNDNNQGEAYSYSTDDIRFGGGGIFSRVVYSLWWFGWQRPTSCRAEGNNNKNLVTTRKMFIWHDDRKSDYLSVIDIFV